MKKPVLTQFSGFANTIADTFRAAFKTSKVGEHAVEMTAPEGSTHGGLLALQHVTLKPPTGMTLIVGTVNAAEKRAEIRSYAHVNRVHEERFKKKVPFAEAAYGEFLEKAESVLSAFGLEVKVTDIPRDDAPSFRENPREKSAAASQPRTRPPIVAIAGIAVGVALMVAAIWMACS
jgi:hypothetical protein